MVAGIASRKLESPLELPTQLELVAKTLQENHSTEVGQMGLLEGQTQCLQAFGHGCTEKMTGFYSWTPSVLLVRNASKPLYNPTPASIPCSIAYYK